MTVIGITEQSRPHAVVYAGIKNLLAKADTDEIRISVAAVARLFAVSRPPAERALAMLAEEGLLRPGAGGKFVRPPLAEHAGARSTSLEDLVRDLPDADIGTDRQRGSWLQLYDQVVQVVVSVTAFGSYKIIESAMANHYGVSRTITNDVLNRLEERGLIARGPRGRWQIEQLSLRRLADIYQLRRTLEPVALMESAPSLDRRFIEGAIARIDEASKVTGSLQKAQSSELEQDLHALALRHCPNDRMLAVIRNCQVLRTAQLYMPNQSASLDERAQYLEEHRTVFEALGRGAYALAAEALIFHLSQSGLRAATRLELASTAPTPEVPPFLVPTGDDTD